MATLKTLLDCFAAGQLLVTTPNGLGFMQSVEAYSAGPVLLVQLDHEKKYFEADELKPVLAGFNQLRADAHAGGKVAVAALAMIAQAVARITPAGQHLHPEHSHGLGIEAQLSQIDDRAQGWGKIAFDLSPLWHPRTEPAKDPRQWQPVAITGWNHYLLSHGYAAGIPSKEWISEDGAKLLQYTNN